MKLSNIILEIKRIGKSATSFRVPISRPFEGNQNLEFTERKIEFTLNQDGKLDATSRLWTKAGTNSDSSLRHYLNKPTNVDTYRKNIVAHYRNNTDGFADTIEANPELIDLPLPRLLQFLEKKFKIDITKITSGVNSKATKSRDQLFLRSSTFRVDTSDVDYKTGIYIWVIDGEMRYVGLTSDIKDRPNKNYGVADGWNTVFGTTGNRMNSYITARLEKETNADKYNDIVRVFTAPVVATDVDLEEMSSATMGNGKPYGNFRKFFREQVLAKVEGQVKAWTANLTSGKVDSDGLAKEKTPGRGSYGRSGDLNKANIKNKK